MSGPTPRRTLRWIVITAALLCVPLVANQVSDEFTWTAGDFVVAAGLILFAGLAFDRLARRWAASAHRAASALAILASFLLVWINLAVGLLGSEDHPANLLYGIVLLVVVTGFAVAGRRPQIMARTLFLAATIQFLIPLVALVIWRPSFDAAGASAGLLGVLALNTFFAVLYGLAGWLFRRPAHIQSAEV